MNNGNRILEMKNISQNFKQGGSNICILSEANFFLRSAETVALVGPSGAGKTTFLQIGGLLEQPDSGEIFISGKNCSRIPDNQRTSIRSKYIGFVYQYHHLLHEFTALENIILPQLILGKSKVEAKDRALSLLKRLGMTNRIDHKPGKLSGGEQQRVAIGRALSNNPKVILADEPTGNLDYSTATEVFDFLIETVKETGLSAVVATHNMDLAGKMDRVITIDNGLIVPA